jgi:hypothetical protein
MASAFRLAALSGSWLWIAHEMRSKFAAQRWTEASIPDTCSSVNPPFASATRTFFDICLANVACFSSGPAQSIAIPDILKYPRRLYHHDTAGGIASFAGNEHAGAQLAEYLDLFTTWVAWAERPGREQRGRRPIAVSATPPIFAR